MDFSKLGAQATPETKETPSATPAADVTMTKTITAEDKASADALNLDKLKINPEPEPAPPVLDAPEDSVRIELQTNTTIPKVNENPVSTAKVAPSPKKKEELNLNPKIIKDNKMDVREITQVLNLPNTNPGKSQTPKAKKAKEKELTFTTTKTIMPFPERTTQFTFMRTVYSQQLTLEAPNSIKDTKDPQEALMSSFRTLKDYFK